MSFADVFVIVTVGIFALSGALRGFLREAVGTVAWIIGLFAAWHLGGYLEPHLGGLLAQATVRTWAARAIIVVVVLFLGAASGTVAAHYVRLSLSVGLDGLLGLSFGVLRGLLLIGVLVLLGQLLQLDGERWWHRSALIPYGEAVANGVRVLVGEPRVHHGLFQRRS